MLLIFIEQTLSFFFIVGLACLLVIPLRLLKNCGSISGMMMIAPALHQSRDWTFLHLSLILTGKSRMLPSSGPLAPASTQLWWITVKPSWCLCIMTLPHTAHWKQHGGTLPRQGSLLIQLSPVERVERMLIAHASWRTAKHIYNPITCEEITKTRGQSVWSQLGLHDDLVNLSYMLRLSQINNPRTIDKVSISLIFVCSLLWLILIVNLRGFRLALETCLWVCHWGSLKTHTLDVDNITP